MTSKAWQAAEEGYQGAQATKQPPSAKPLGASKSATAPGSVDLATLSSTELMLLVTPAFDDASKVRGQVRTYAAFQELVNRAKELETLKAGHAKLHPRPLPTIGGETMLKKGQRVHVDVPGGTKADGTVMHDWDHSMFYVRLHLDGRPEGQIVSVCRKYVQLIAQEK